MATARFNPDRNIAFAFIDCLLPDLQTILAGLDTSVTAVALETAQDGIRQMADALVGMSGLNIINVVSYGTSGQINFGAAQFSQDLCEG